MKYLNNFFKFIIAVAVVELVGVIGAVFTMPAILGWFAELEKPALMPPAEAFGPVWTLLYFLIGVSLFLVWKNGWKTINPIFEKKVKSWNRWSERLWVGDLQKANAVSIFALQFILNAAWPYLFFGLHLPDIAFSEILMLWFAIVWMIVVFYRISQPAAYLLIPYLLWVSFAAYLNYAIWALN